MLGIWKSLKKYMKNTSVSIVNKLSSGLGELYADIDAEAKRLNIPYLVVGAMARDLVLVHGYGSKIERGTRDVDFGIKVETWEQFNSLSEGLITLGFSQDSQVSHRFKRTDKDGLPWDIDIVPFGDISDEKTEISWPPNDDFVMNVMGFREAFDNALSVEIYDNPQVIIPVCSPIGIGLLKLVAWLDRGGDKRKKDASDILYLITTYAKIPEVQNSIYEDGYMEANDWDDLQASADKLGCDIFGIASPSTRGFIVENLTSKQDNFQVLCREMKGSSMYSIEECSKYLALLLKGF
jgi:predicted nucleotidyltransferase